jgi:membrane-associated phospholipid phosphatase
MEGLLLGVVGSAVSAIMIGVAYYLPRFITGKNVKYHQLKTRLDDKTPFVNWFVVFYLIAYIAAVAAPFATIIFGGEQALFRWLICIGAFSAVSFAAYLFYPTICPRDKNAKKLRNGSVFDRAVAFVYRHDDPPISCCPSFHNGVIWLALFFYVAIFPSLNIIIAAALGALAVLVSLSTLFIRQHYLIDVVVSIIIAFVITLLVGII